MFFSPKHVADIIGASAATVRRYAAQFGDQLSVYANPEPGKRRSFTEQDVRTLRRIKDYFAAGLPADEIANQLSLPEKSVEEEAQDFTIEGTLALLADQKKLLDAQAQQIADNAQRITQLYERVAALEARIRQTLDSQASE